MQQLTRNKFVSPTTAGSLEAAQLGLLTGLLLFPMAGTFVKTLFAFGFTFIASLIFLQMVDRIRVRNVIFVPLVGLMFGGVLSSVASFMAVNYNILQDMNAWMMGDFSGVMQGKYELIYLCLPRSEEHTSELQSRGHLVCRLLLEKKKHDKQHT